MAQKLYRSETDRIVAGLCGGLGEFFDIDSTIIRIIFIILTIWGGVGLILYIIGVLVVPRNPQEEFSGRITGRKNHQEFSQKIEEVASEVRENIMQRNRSGLKGEQFLGIIILVAGGILLVQEIFPKYGFHLFWPVLLILFGLLILFSGGRRRGGK